MKTALNLILIISAVAFFGCSTVYYSTMEKFGYQKRDILTERVEYARDAQIEAKNQFRSALDKFKAVVDFKGGGLEEKYTVLKAELSLSEEKASAVSKKISDVENVADALFSEWQKELRQYTDEDLRKQSRLKLEQTRARYDKLIGSMKTAEGKIQPVLDTFRDHVLFLKHNLNAQAVASLQKQVVSIESDVSSLIRSMESSISAANSFITNVSRD
ncbi:MAG: DUF2959 domain-containing protein [Candidatus Brocadiia bacterium]|nr:MAG: DUF2959 domain-containing protein [Candidatus Brocadiia bacterium]